MKTVSVVVLASMSALLFACSSEPGPTIVNVYPPASGQIDGGEGDAGSSSSDAAAEDDAPSWNPLGEPCTYDSAKPETGCRRTPADYGSKEEIQLICWGSHLFSTREDMFNRCTFRCDYFSNETTSVVEDPNAVQQCRELGGACEKVSADSKVRVCVPQQ